MKKLTKHLLVAAALAIGLTGTLAASQANAQVNVDVGTVRVRLPNGTYISLGNTPDNPWWYDYRVTPYRRYIYDPVERVYVVHSDSYFVRHPNVRYTVIDRRPRGDWHDNGGHGRGHYDNGWHGRGHGKHDRDDD